ncbi:MAG: hypothetical protein WA705_29415 [Candidatus Ozemobacteraceae bacterium]
MNILLGVIGIIGVFAIAYYLVIYLPGQKRCRLFDEAKTLWAGQKFPEAAEKLLSAYCAGIKREANAVSANFFLLSQEDSHTMQRDILRLLIQSLENSNKKNLPVCGKTNREKEVLSMVREFGKHLLDRSLANAPNADPPVCPFTLRAVQCRVCMNWIFRNSLVSRLKRWNCPVCGVPIYAHLPGGLDENIF